MPCETRVIGDIDLGLPTPWWRPTRIGSLKPALQVRTARQRPQISASVRPGGGADHRLLMEIDPTDCRID